MTRTNKKYLSLSFSLEDLIKNLIRLFGTLDFQGKYRVLRLFKKGLL